jgi:hypothetical protein
MVFRLNTAPPLSRFRAGGEVSGEGEGGILFFAGKDGNSLGAWVSQLLQERPGAFPPPGDIWAETAARLYREGRFQRGAPSFSWADVWDRFFGEPLAWVYAPLSAAESLPGHRAALLEADRFPEGEGWTGFGLQARVLWARPFGLEGRSPAAGKRMEEALGEAREWLSAPGTQSDLAAELGWIPARREGRPHNPIAASAQRAWLGSSFIWETSLTLEE